MENIAHFPHVFLSQISQIYIYMPYYLFTIINCFIIFSFQIADSLYENQASVRILRNEWHIFGYEST